MKNIFAVARLTMIIIAATLAAPVVVYMVAYLAKSWSNFAFDYLPAMPY